MMLLKLHSSAVLGVSIIDQIIDYFQGMIVADGWPNNTRTPTEIITELDIVVSDEDFSNALDHYHAFLYVGTTQDLPTTFASFYRSQPFSDWIILLKPKEDRLADPIYIFAAQSSQPIRPTLH
jgi:hypothetical protein